jgi:predicted outer membrane repeat protein
MGNVSAASSDSIYVNSSSGNDNYNGISSIWTSGLNGPKATIKNATGTVTTDGTVHIASGTYNESNIQINTNMKIIGENQNNTIINGKQSGYIFTIASRVNLTIINLTLTNATSNYGAILNYGILTVDNSTFTGNTANFDGGAITNQLDGTLTVKNSSFTENTAIAGGAIFNSGTLTVNNSSFTGNTATNNCGAIFNSGTLTVDNSTFTGNTATYYGGAIYNNFGGASTVKNSSFTENTAIAGGALFNYGTLTVGNSSFTGNTVTNNGGAIYNYGTLTVGNSSFTGNTATNTGCAIDNYGTAVVNFNRIIGNSAIPGSDIYNHRGTVDARFNWWGSNTNPSVYISGSDVTYDPWIVLTVTSNPKTIDVNGKSTITVDLLHDSDGVYHDPVNGHVSDGLIVTFSCDTKGTVNPISSTITNGSTTTTFTGLQPGVSQILTNVDAQTETTNVKINTPTAIVVNPISGYKGDIVNLIANLTYTDGNVPISGKTVQFSVNGNVVGTSVTDSNGIATLPYTIQENSGIYTILAEFTGDTTYPASSNTNTLTVTNIPTAKASPNGGLYNTAKSVTITMNEPGNIYYTTNGATPTNTSNLYTGPITIKSTTTLKYLAEDLMGNKSTIYSATYTIDKKTPTANANIKPGLYNTNKVVKLTMNKKGTIYYTLNRTTPTINSKKYNGPITIKSTTTLKYLAVDLAGNKSPVYTATYTIDKTAPKVISTKPKNNSKGISLTTIVTIKFSEKISKTTKFSKIHIKNLTTGKFTHTTTKLSGNTITVKMIRSRLSYNHYQVIIPTSAVKDKAGNTNKKCLINFKTRRY